jgi:hypothetical protein
MASKYYDEREERDPAQQAQANDDGETLTSGPEDEDPFGALSKSTESEGGAAESPQGSTRRRARREATRSQQIGAESQFDPDGGDDETESGSELVELAEKGFTADEAIRLIHVSQRAAMSREAREAEETLRRLRFTRWLIEHGMLDEFSA